MLNTFDLRPQAEVTERHRTGPDALTFTFTPIANREWRASKAANEKGKGAYSNVSLGHTHDRELFKLRTMPHLYEAWHIDLAEDQRMAYLHTLPDDAIDWDCQHCKTSVITYAATPAECENARCPLCGRK